MQQTQSIDGPAGTIEAMLDRVSPASTTIAILCHPHPLYGGSMHDGVVDAAASVLLNEGISVLRFNFRGVGQSEGTHAKGEGEADDVAAVVAWALESCPSDSIILAGYSFGANVAWRAAYTLPKLVRLILIAPPVGMMPFTSPAPACPVHVVYGDADEYIDPAALAAWTGVTRHQVDGANHFFMGEWQGLTTAIANALK
jgi:uncharacterized protein